MKKIIATFTSFLAVVSLLLASPVLAATVVVSQSSNTSWNFIEGVPGTGAVVDFVTGPTNPPNGSAGSLHFFTGTNGENFLEARNGQFGGGTVKLSDINALSYDTFVTSSGTGVDAPLLWLEVYNPLSNQVDILLYDPASNGTVSNGIWQSWDALSGNWLKTNGGNFIGTLANYIAISGQEGAVLTNQSAGGGIRLTVGGGSLVSDVFDQNVDAFTIGVVGSEPTTYDFENVSVVSTTPTNKDECKKGGWQNFNNPVFKNQGSCVSYVEANVNAGKQL